MRLLFLLALLVPLAGCIAVSPGDVLPSIYAFEGSATYRVSADGVVLGELRWSAEPETLLDASGSLRELIVERFDRDFDAPALLPSLFQRAAVSRCGFIEAQWWAGASNSWLFDGPEVVSFGLPAGWSTPPPRGQDGYWMTDFRPGTGGDIQVVGSILDDAAVRESWRFWYEADSGAPVRFESDQDGQHFEGVRTEMDGHSMPVSCAGLPAEHAAALDGTWGPDGPMEYPKTEPSTGEVIRQVRDDPELAEFQDYVRRHGDPLLLAVSYDDGQTYGDDSTRWWLTFVSPGADELVDVFCSGRPPTLPILSAAPECQAAARNGTLDWLRPDPGPMTSVAHWRDVIDMLGGWSIDNWGMHRSDTSIILDFVNGPKNIHGIDHRLTVDSMSGQISSWDGWVAR